MASWVCEMIARHFLVLAALTICLPAHAADAADAVQDAGGSIILSQQSGTGVSRGLAPIRPPTVRPPPSRSLPDPAPAPVYRPPVRSLPPAIRQPPDYRPPSETGPANEYRRLPPVNRQPPPP
jgi:hypothetical protein